MNLLIAVFVLFCIGLAGAVVLVLKKTALLGATMPATIDWIDELSTERYRPMLRLLGREDLDFLRSQPGCATKLLAAVRRQRVQVFRGYLRQLGTDFGRTCAAVKLLMVQASCDRPELASTLVRSQVAFAAGLLAVQVRLTFYAWGVGTPNVGDLLKLFDGMRLELRTLVPAATPIGA
jgi:uncharacterized membrane protein